jgi:hypothetical protein
VGALDVQLIERSMMRMKNGAVQRRVRSERATMRCVHGRDAET